MNNPKKVPWRKHPVNITRHKDLSANAYRLWSVIRSLENKDGIASAGMDALEDGCNLDRKTINRAEKELVGHGLLKVIFKPRGRKKGNAKYTTLEQPKEFGQKRTAYENSTSLSIPDRTWLEKMDRKHDCGGCGWCLACRTHEAP